MKTSLRRTKRILDAIKVHRNRKHISYYDACVNLYRSMGAEINRYNLSTVQKFITSDTIFLLGSGPSLNDLSDIQLSKVNDNDSFGMSYSFVKKEIVPTFHQFANEEPWGFNFCIETFLPYRKIYKNVVTFIHTKQLLMMNHPRTTPLIFPEEPKYCLYKLPKSIHLEVNRPFSDSDFEKNLIYRNIMSVILDIVVKMRYKNIVLLGVDLDKWAFFYDKMPEMDYYVKRLYKARKDMNGRTKFDTMYPKGEKYHTFDVYLNAVSEYLRRKKDINLFVAFKENMLYPGIPAYFD